MDLPEPLVVISDVLGFSGVVFRSCVVSSSCVIMRAFVLNPFFPAVVISRLVVSSFGTYVVSNFVGCSVCNTEVNASVFLSVLL